MPSTGRVFNLRMPAGIPGTINRSHHAVVEPQYFDSTNMPTAYGVFMKIVNERMVPVASGDAATVIKGILVRPFPTQEGAFTPSFGAGAPAGAPFNNLVGNLLRRGYIMARLSSQAGVGTAAKEGQVYVRVTAAGGKVVGDIEAAADSTNNVAVPGAVFTGPADADGNVEISFKIN